MWSVETHGRYYVEAEQIMDLTRILVDVTLWVSAVAIVALVVRLYLFLWSILKPRTTKE